MILFREEENSMHAPDDCAKELRAEMVQNFKIGAAAKVWALDDVPPPRKGGDVGRGRARDIDDGSRPCMYDGDG